MKHDLKYVGKQLVILLLILLLAIVVIALGLMIGYGVIGDGDHIWSILSPEKWQEIGKKFTGQ